MLGFAEDTLFAKDLILMESEKNKLFHSPGKIKLTKR